MLLETFRGRDLPRVLAEVRAAFGDDAMILRTRSSRKGGATEVEVVATTGAELEAFRRRLERFPLRLEVDDAGVRERPHVVALVGSTGAGKTTSIAKLALHADAFGERSVGLVTLDTYRVGALEQLETYAQIAGLPLEVVYAESEVEGALERLSDCDVVLVDTPGRSPKATPASQEWREPLRAIRPDEVHLVVPASARIDAALATLDAFEACGITHALITKIDEVPDETAVVELVDALGLPARWVSTGQEVPFDLHPAAPRIMAALCGEAGTFRAAV